MRQRPTSTIATASRALLSYRARATRCAVEHAELWRSWTAEVGAVFLQLPTFLQVTLTVGAAAAATIRGIEAAPSDDEEHRQFICESVGIDPAEAMAEAQAASLPDLLLFETALGWHVDPRRFIRQRLFGIDVARDGGGAQRGRTD